MKTMTGGIMLKDIIMKMNRISIEIAKFIEQRWKLTEEQLNGDTLTSYLDSLDIIELAMELEKRFGITISDEELHDWRFFSDVVRCVYLKVVSKQK